MSHHQYPTELHTVCDVVRWAMSEMERFDVSLGHGTADYWEDSETPNTGHLTSSPSRCRICFPTCWDTRTCSPISFNG